jgi:hypothetical protein
VFTDAEIRFGQRSGTPAPAPGFGRVGGVVGVALVLAIAGGLLWSASAGHPVAAQHPRLFGGSLVLEDQRQLTVVDVATGAVVVGLQSVQAEVGAAADGDVQAVPVTGGTMLIDRSSGTFNLLGPDNYVLDAAGPGVGLGHLPGLTGASGLPAGPDAYIVRYAPRSTVSLVGAGTVLSGANLEGPPAPDSGRTGDPGLTARVVTPLGFTALSGPVANQPGAGAVSHGDLWLLVGADASCQVRQLQAAAARPNGLISTLRATLPTSCRRAAVEAVPGAIGVAYPGQVRLFRSDRPGRAVDVPVPGTGPDTSFLPVEGAVGALWYLAAGASGWSVFGVTPAGRVVGPSPLDHFGPGARPVAPVESGGVLFTLDRAAVGQPGLWTILPATGAMIPLAGVSTYPRRVAAEQATFSDAEVLVDGPRVVFNNPGSLLAVMVFTDGSHSPVVIDKSSAVAISTVGPTVAAGNAGRHDGGRAPTPSTAAPRATSLVQAVNPAVTCATTTQKPYAPQITSVAPSSGSALVTWSYLLLDQGDCEPDSWSVTVTALSTSRQPGQPVQVVDGQTQLEFYGLRPASTYQAVVRAYINKQSTASIPVTFTTAARGPDPPTFVHTVADGRGDWVVSWAPCTAADCFVPADTWNVVGMACGSSFVGQPPVLQVPSGHSSVTIDADRFGLLGDSLSFSVQGLLSSGPAGNPATDHACTEAWRPPNPGLISVGASGAPASSPETITATLQVSARGVSAVEAFGSPSTEFVYSVGGHTVGPVAAATVTVPGLAGGRLYTPSVEVFPTGHPDAAVVIPGPAFRRNLVWPSPPTLAVRATPVVGSNPDIGTLILSFVGLPAGPAVADNGSITCGSTQYPTLIQDRPVINNVLSVPRFDLVHFGGACQVSLVLASAAIPDPYGGVSSLPLSTSFVFGTQPAYRFTDQISPACQHTFCRPGQQQLEVDYAGPEPSVLKAGGNWEITSSGGGGRGQGRGDPGACDETVGLSPPPPTFPIIVPLPNTCLDATSVDITVTYMYLGQTTTVAAGTPSGTPATTTTTTTSTSSTTTATTSTTSTTTPGSTTRITAVAQRAALAGPAGEPVGGPAAQPTRDPAARPTREPTVDRPVAPTGDPATVLAAAPAAVAASPPGDAEVRLALEWTLLAAVGAWCTGRLRRAHRRRARRQLAHRRPAHRRPAHRQRAPGWRAHGRRTDGRTSS